MTTGLFVRYQELIGLLECEANKDGIDAHLPCVDVLVPLEGFIPSFVDSIQAECLKGDPEIIPKGRPVVLEHTVARIF